MLNGCGTTLYGRTWVPSQRGYVATKFFCLFWIPVVPMESYLILEESGFDAFVWASKDFRMVRLERVYSPHMKVWGYSWAAATVLLLLLVLFILVSK